MDEVKKDKVRLPGRERKQAKAEDDVNRDSSPSPGRDSKQEQEEDEGKKDEVRPAVMAHELFVWGNEPELR
jgi:hypothetical protein